MRELKRGPAAGERRGSNTIGLVWLIAARAGLVLATLLVDPANAGPTEQEEWRLLFSDGRIERRSTRPSLDHAKDMDLRAAWTWSNDRAPTRLDAAQIAAATFPKQPRRLEANVIARALPGSQPSLLLYAAPMSMWLEMPETELPAWSVPADGRLSLPWAPGERWRLRLAGENEGSWWLDIGPNQSTARIVAAPSARLAISIFGSEGEELESASVALLAPDEHGEPGLLARYTPDRGRLVVRGLPDQRRIRLEVKASPAAPAAMAGFPGDLPSRWLLPPGAEVRGRAVDEGRLPLEGVAVALEAWSAPGSPLVFRARARTAADGTWTMRGVPVGEVSLLFERAGGAPVRRMVLLVAGGNDLGAETLPLGAVATIRVTDDLDRPIPRAKVEAGSVPELTTDASGRVTPRIAPDRPLEVRVRADGHLEARGRFGPPFNELFTIRLQRTFGLRGRIIDSGGSPVVEARIRVESGTLCQSSGVEVDGRFSVDLPPDRPARLIVSSPVSEELRVEISPGLPEELRDLGDLILIRGRSVVGRLIDGASGDPVPHANVWALRPTPMGPAVTWSEGDLLRARSDADGKFRVDGLKEGPQSLRVDAPGYARAYLDAGQSLEEDSLDLGEIPLARGTRLRVLVPLDGPDEELTPVARVDLRGDWLEPDMLVAEVREGLARFRSVPAGPARVTVLAGPRLLCELEVDVPEDEEELEVDCDRDRLELDGVVFVGEMTAEAGWLVWSRPGPELPGRIDNRYSPAGLRRQQVVGLGRPDVQVAVLDDGSFRTRDVAPGTWQVQWSPAGGSRGPRTTVEIPRADVASIIVRFGGESLLGRVVDREDRPVTDAQVMEHARGAFGRSDEVGAFRLHGLGAGPFALQARSAEGASRVVEGEIEPGRAIEPIVLVLGEERALHLDVTVERVDGTSAVGAFVFLQEEGKGQRILTVGSAGRAEAEIASPLPKLLRVAATDGTAWAFGEWVSWDLAKRGLALRLGSGALHLASADQRGRPTIGAPNGWDLSRLLVQIGLPPVLAPEQPLRLFGLPPGTYEVRLGDVALEARVRADDVTALVFEE